MKADAESGSTFLKLNSESGWEKETADFWSSSTFVKSRNREIPRCVVDSIQAINSQNADKIIGLTLFLCF